MPTAVVNGNASGWMKFTRRTSAGSMSSATREEVHRALDRVRGFGAAGAAVRARGRGRGGERLRRELDLGDVVHTRCHDHRHRGQPGADVGVRAAVLVDRHVQADDAAVARRADLDRLLLATAVAHGDEVLAAGLGPPHRAAELTRQPRGEDLLGGREALGAEATADVTADHADLARVEAEVAGHHHLDHADALRRRVIREALAVPHRRARAPFHRRRCDAVADHRFLDDHVGAVEQALDGRSAELGHHVARRLGEHHDVVRHRGRAVDDRRERVVVDLDQLGRVVPEPRVLRDDGDDGLAHEPHAVACEHRPQLRVVEVREERGRDEIGQADVGGGHHRDDTGCGPRGIDVDRADQRVRERRAHERHVQRVVEVDGADVLAAAGEQARVFGADDAASEDAHQSSPSSTAALSCSIKRRSSVVRSVPSKNFLGSGKPSGCG